jgi:hypothetical protein
MAGQRKTRDALVVLKTAEGAAKLIELAEQGKGIDIIAAELGIPRGAITKWLDEPEHAELFTRARTRAADHLAHEALEISDDLEGDVPRDRLRVDTRKWLASKWNAAQYGDSKGVQVNLNLADLHLQAVKVVKPVHEPDTLTLEADVAPRQPD